MAPSCTVRIPLLILALTLSGLVCFANAPKLIPIRVDSKWGYCNPQRQVVIAPAFDAARPFQDGIGIVQRGNSVGAIAPDGRMILPAQYEDILPGSLLRLRRNGKLALATRSGRVITPFEFDEAIPRIGQLHEVRVGDRCGMYDSAGTRVVPIAYDMVRCLRDTRGRNAWLIEVRQDGKLGLYTYCGDPVQAPRFDLIGPFNNGFAITRIGNKFGMIAQDGSEVTPCIYDNLLEMREGRSPALVGGRWGFIDEKGKEVIPFRFEAVHESGFHEGRAPVLMQGVWRVVDRQGNLEMSMNGPYSYVGPVSEGLMTATRLENGGMRHGYIDPQGNVRIPLRYDAAGPFHRGLAIVGRRSDPGSMRPSMQYGIIDRKGRSILPIEVSSQTEAEMHRDSILLRGWTWLDDGLRRCRYDIHGNRTDCGPQAWEKLVLKFTMTRCEQSSLVAVQQGGLWGYANATGRLVVPCKYRMAECFSQGLAKVWPSDGGAFFFIDASGNEYAGS